MGMVSSFFMEHGVEIASLPPLSNTSSDIQSYWHCLHSMRQGLCNGTVSVRLSFCPSIRPLHAAAASLLLRATPELSMGPFRVTQPNPWTTMGHAGRRCRSMGAARRVCSRRGRLSIHIHGSTAVGSECEQCRVVRWRRKLNTDLFRPVNVACCLCNPRRVNSANLCESADHSGFTAARSPQYNIRNRCIL